MAFAAPAHPARAPVTRYAKSGHVHIAYQVVGDGPRDVVFVPGWASHVELAASRGVLSRAAGLIDEHRAANPTSDGSAEQLGALFAEAQAAKAFVNEAAARTVERALALSGGAGYLNGSPLARAYRDVKAGSFMHPLGANRAYDYLAHVALGEHTPLH